MRNAKIIAFEGIHSSGKSTLINELVQSKIIPESYKYIISDWNSSSILKDHVINLKKQLSLTPYTLIYLELADFAHRFANEIVSSLNNKDFILLDRSLLTLVTRGIVRGINKKYLMDLIEPYKKPDLIFFIDIDPIDAFKRRKKSNGCFDGYLSGSDFLSGDKFNNFIEYSRMLNDAYYELINYSSLNVEIINSNNNIIDSIEFIWKKMIDV